jgi:hypothetical protein
LPYPAQHPAVRDAQARWQSLRGGPAGRLPQVPTQSLHALAQSHSDAGTPLAGRDAPESKALAPRVADASSATPAIPTTPNVARSLFNALADDIACTSSRRNGARRRPTATRAATLS